jgi:hypothetical protein
MDAAISEDSMEEFMMHDEELKRQLILEQYRQAAEEHRAEDNNTWQTFAIILALNGALVGFLNFDSTPQSLISLFLSTIIGMISVYGGICIIGRTRLYQMQRICIAEKIQNITDIHLYYSESIDDYMKREYPNEPIKWDERRGGRKTMKIILMNIGFMWLLVGLYLFITQICIFI